MKILSPWIAYRSIAGVSYGRFPIETIRRDFNSAAVSVRLDITAMAQYWYISNGLYSQYPDRGNFTAPEIAQAKADGWLVENDFYLCSQEEYQKYEILR